MNLSRKAHDSESLLSVLIVVLSNGKVNLRKTIPPQFPQLLSHLPVLFFASLIRIQCPEKRLNCWYFVQRKMSKKAGILRTVFMEKTEYLKYDNHTHKNT